MAHTRCICASYAHDLALDLSRKSRDVIQSDKYQVLFPHIRLKEDQNAKGYFINEHKGYRFAVGTGGAVTGFHGHFIIIDDPINPKEAASEATLKTANTWMSETISTRKIDKLVSVTILIMQRLHENDPAAAMLSRAAQGKSRVRHINLPAEIETDLPTDPQQLEKTLWATVSPRKLVRNYKDGLLDPVRLPKIVLIEMEGELTDYGYAGQMLQRPVPMSGGLFKIDRIRIEEPPSKFKSKVRFWDKAATEGGTGAYTASVLMGIDLYGYFWILDVIRGRWDSGSRERIIKQTAEIDGKKVFIGVEQEGGSGGKESAENTVRMLAGWVASAVKPSGDKVVRALPFSSQVNQGQVKMKPGLWNEDYIHELQFFPLSKHKDQVDASSGAFTLLSKSRKQAGGLGR